MSTIPNCQTGALIGSSILACSTFPCRTVQSQTFISHSATSCSLLRSLPSSTLSVQAEQHHGVKRRWLRGERGRAPEQDGQKGNGGHLSAVVIKACVLKRGQSIQLSASASHQTSWRRLKMSCRVQAASSGCWESERATGGTSQESL